MFTRSSRGAFICLRCQTRLARQDQWLPKPATIARRTRWQSTAAARVEEDDDSNLQYPPQEPPDRTPKYKRDTKYRKWRPSPVEQLGVSSLGKPAEVLVLPARDRRIPIVPSDDHDSEQKVQESLDAELQPLSPEQVNENIEQIKEQFGEPREHMADVDFKKLQHSISSGFTQKQLTRYIEQNLRPGMKKFRINKVNRSWKQQMAFYVAKHMWGYSSAELVEESTEVVSRATVKLSKHDLESMLVQRSQPLQSLSQTNKVQVDVYREQCQVVLSGSASGVAAGKAALGTMKNAIKKGELKLDHTTFVHRQLTNDEMGSLLQKVGERHGVHLVYQAKHQPKRKASSLDIYYHKNELDSVAAIRREIVMASTESEMHYKHLSFPLKPEPVVVPVYPPGDLPFSQRSIQWGRYTSSSGDSGGSDISTFTVMEREDFSTAYLAVRRHLRNGMNNWSLDLPANSREEFMARFGQVGFERKVAQSESPTGSVTQEALMSTFIPRIPVLPQYLASVDGLRRKPDASGSLLAEDGTVEPFHFCITLAPARSGTSLPVIEIRLVGTDSKLALRQPLKVLGIQAILQHRTFDLLLPKCAVDVRFTRQAKLDLYDPASKQDPKHSRLLKQIGTFLARGGEQGEPSFTSFVDLNLHPILAKPQSQSIAMAADETSSTLVKKPNSKKTEYVLQSAEVVDIASFQPRINPNLYLNHTTTDGGIWGAGSQSLSLSSQPMFESPVKKGVKFSGFFNSAYSIATTLGKPKFMG